MGLRRLLAGETGNPRSALGAPFVERPPRISPMQSESFLVTCRKEPTCPARRSTSGYRDVVTGVQPDQMSRTFRVWLKAFSSTATWFCY